MPFFHKENCLHFLNENRNMATRMKLLWLEGRLRDTQSKKINGKEKRTPQKSSKG
jgi:hypothetical protein